VGLSKDQAPCLKTRPCGGMSSFPTLSPYLRHQAPGNRLREIRWPAQVPPGRLPTTPPAKPLAPRSDAEERPRLGLAAEGELVPIGRARGSGLRSRGRPGLRHGHQGRVVIVAHRRRRQHPHRHRSAAVRGLGRDLPCTTKGKTPQEAPSAAGSTGQGNIHDH
jgi:hypothetical protein